MSAYSTCSSGEGEVFSSSSSESEENETEIIEEEGESKLTLSKCVCRVLELIVKPKPIIALVNQRKLKTTDFFYTTLLSATKTWFTCGLMWVIFGVQCNCKFLFSPKP